MPTPPTRRILGVDFFIGTLDAAVELTLLAPGPLDTSSSPVTSHQSPATRCALVVAPSAPGLAVDLVHAPAYRHALQTADLVLTDSGFMVLLWRLFTGEPLPRHSGLKFLRAVLARTELKQPGAVFWVMPSATEAARNEAWLRTQGFPITPDDVYIAPVYPTTGELIDHDLLTRLQKRRPRVIMLAIGGGVQERLGVALRAQLLASSLLVPSSPTTSSQLLAPSDERPATSILCLGAAIAFLTGGQTNIPPWADKLVLGWLLRLFSNPRKFWRRYWEALRLAPLLWRWRERTPGAPPNQAF